MTREDDTQDRFFDPQKKKQKATTMGRQEEEEGTFTDRYRSTRQNMIDTIIKVLSFRVVNTRDLKLGTTHTYTQVRQRRNHKSHLFLDFCVKKKKRSGWEWWQANGYADRHGVMVQSRKSYPGLSHDSIDFHTFRIVIGFSNGYL